MNAESPPRDRRQRTCRRRHLMASRIKRTFSLNVDRGKLTVEPPMWLILLPPLMDDSTLFNHCFSNLAMARSSSLFTETWFIEHDSLAT